VAELPATDADWTMMVGGFVLVPSATATSCVQRPAIARRNHRVVVDFANAQTQIREKLTSRDPKARRASGDNVR